MKKIIAVVAVLAMASMAHGVALSVGATAPVAPGATLEIPILISGGETNIQGITMNVAIPAGGILGYNPKAGILAGSSNTPDAPFIFNNATGEPATAGTPVATAVYSDFSMNFGAFATANGVAGVVSVTTAGLAPGTYDVMLESMFGKATVGGAEVSATAGAFTVVPEPAAALLLGLGGLFLRRRHA